MVVMMIFEGTVGHCPYWFVLHQFPSELVCFFRQALRNGHYQ